MLHLVPETVRPHGVELLAPVIIFMWACISMHVAQNPRLQVQHAQRYLLSASARPAVMKSCHSAMYQRHRLNGGPTSTHVPPHIMAHMRCQRQAFRSHRKQTSCACLACQVSDRRNILVSGGAAAVLGMLSSLPHVAHAAGSLHCISTNCIEAASFDDGHVLRSPGRPHVSYVPHECR